MARSLSGRLALVLLALFILLGGLFTVAMVFATRLHYQEVTQRFNRPLARHLASDRELVRDGSVDDEAASEIFHMLMVVNPSIEIYLLDRGGKILSFSAPPGKVRLERVSLDPVRRFLAGDGSYPIFGDDPRNPGGSKVFSAAALASPEGPQGYLYVILGGEAYESATHLFRASYILRLSLLIVAGGLFFSLVAGMYLFAKMTRRLGLLAGEMERFRLGDFVGGMPSMRGAEIEEGDEIDRLRRVFALMAERINLQVGKLKDADENRRELVTNVSHDLRTPLASLKGYLETMAMKGGALAESEREDYLTTALENAGELERRVDELLELARLDSPDITIELEEFPLEELVEALVQKFRLRASEKGVSIEAQAPAALPFVLGNIELVKRVLENLIENALRCTDRGDRIEVALERGRETVTLRVSDTGRGIPPQEIERIFERHFSSGRGGRAGLGLAISRKIAELHGSDLAVESEPGKGSTFSFTLRVRRG